MNNSSYGVVAIDKQTYGIPLSAIKTIESSDKIFEVEEGPQITVLDQNFQVLNLLPTQNETKKDLVLVLNAETNIALFVDSFQSLELDHGNMYMLPNIMQSEQSFVDKLHFNAISKEIIYLCQEENFYHYLDLLNE